MIRYWTWIPALVVTVAVPAGAEQMYRWTDESGRTHFSNVGPAGQEIQPEGEARPALEAEPEPAAAAAPASPPRTEGQKKDGGGKYAGLSDDSFSTTASRQRGELQSRLRSAQRELRRIESDLASYRRHRERAFETHAAQLQGVSRPESLPSDEEEKLLEKKKSVEEEIAGIHEQYDQLREAAVERTGAVPGWWRPLE